MGIKKAFLVGINKYESAPLLGCVNDVNDMAELLNTKCGYSASNIRLLTDERATKSAIIERLSWLVSGVRPGDSIVFQYSGHGVQFPARNDTGEPDKLYEAICPYGFDWTDENTIKDKEFVRLFASIPEGVNFLWISDSCHSGDLSRDITFNPHTERRIKRIAPPADIAWRMRSLKSEKQHVAPLGMGKGVGVNVTYISGCRSDQTSADASFHGKPNGALSYCLMAAARDNPKQSYEELHKKTLATLKQLSFEQEPQLEGNSKLFKLSIG